MAIVDRTKIKTLVDQITPQIPELENEIATAKAAGLDVSAASTRLAQLKEQLNKLNTYYLQP